jgi:hypothetical protein
MNQYMIGAAMLLIGFASGAWVTESINVRAQRGAEKGAAAEIAKLKPQTTIVNNKVVEHITTERIYQDCRHSPDAFQTILEAYK